MMSLSRTESAAIEYALSSCKVHFKGFVSDIATLRRNGWEFRADFDDMRRYHTVALTNKEMTVGGHVDMERWDMPLGSGHIEVRPMYSGQAVIASFHVPMFTELTIAPHVLTMERPDELLHTPLKHFFWPAEDKPPELIVDPNEVNSLMDRIIELQRPKQKELREKYRKEKLTTKTAARIITLSDYVA